MAYWGRIRQATVTSLSTQYRRCHLLNQTTTHPITRVLKSPTAFVIRETQIEFGNGVRFFAAPVQAKSKQQEKDTSGRRLNEKITAEFVRLVTEEGHCVVSRREALERARCLNLDLVELYWSHLVQVQRNAKPPVCKLADYHKEKYKQQIKDKERAKSKSEVTLRKGDCKEVRFSVKTEQKDLQMKADMVKRLMDRGYRVKCMALGKEDEDMGGILSRLSALIEDVSVVESGPRVEKKNAYVIVRHVKFGPSKKGSGKKVSNVVANSTVVQSPVQSEDILDRDSEFETDGENLLEEAEMHIPDKKNDTWSPFEANDDYDSVFDLGVEAKPGKNSGDAPMNPAPNRFSDFSPRPVDPVRKESVLPFPVEPRNNNPPPKSVDGKGTSFGIFSASKGHDTPDRHGLPAEVSNRYKKGNSSDSRRHPMPRGVSENARTPLSDTNRSGRPGVDSGEQGKWGIFSTESSNGVPSRNSESYSKFRR
ncbi:hypothetical protein RHGRI_013343 [Rhododendron griersonianum]|uniref:Translation initiation factor 3 N-terminal domain-containing protein n=1 Tax=Rhododendron griersonianum TaxID=479676 RepID=A0AAV6K571_9ERIC|nr:hypothetical protein RHGRI_013343 [Rhododendron griersonianum]